MSNPDVYLVSPGDLRMIWPRVAELFEEHPGLREQFTIDELMTYLLNASCYQLWVGVDRGEIEGIMVTGFVSHVYGNKLHIVGICGEHLFRKYIRLGLSKLEQYGAMTECSEIVFEGRDKWKKIMQKFGYVQSLQMKKNIRRLSVH